MTRTFSQYLRERRERAIDDGDARPMPRAFASTLAAVRNRYPLLDIEDFPGERAL